MKKITIFLAFILTVSSCSFLDQNPEELNTLEKVFSSRSETRKWFSRMYSSDYFPLELWGSAYYNHYMFGTDDANNELDWHIPHVLNGSISPEAPVTSTDVYYFSTFYQAIRHCNIFLEHVDECLELGIVEHRRMKAEARFMRAMYHFYLLREYGPIPIVDHSFTSGMMERRPYDECVEWIVNEMTEAIPDMYETRNDNDLGYPTQGAALAMISRIRLYAASPLFNGNTIYANFKNTDGTQLINQTYDPEKWKKAADAAKAVIDLGRYQLLKPSSANPTFDDYVNNYMRVTTTWRDNESDSEEARNSATEIIRARPQATSWWTMQCLPACFYSWNARDAVTLNMANEYFMADGSVARPLEEWFDEDNMQWSSQVGNGTQRQTFWMFCDREPRFYATTFFPNQRVSYATSDHPDVYETIEFWYSGNAGLSKSSGDHNSTGLSPRKNIPPDAQSNKGEGKCTSRNIPFPVIRLAEVYLNYCEAMNEYKGSASHAEILPYLNAIRERAGIPGYHGSYSQEEMREMIRHERRVELVWECHRYFDVRRWFIAHGENGALNTPVYGLNVAEGTGPTDPSFFKMVEGIPRTFRIEHYLAPIKSSEIALNPKMVQAPHY